MTRELHSSSDELPPKTPPNTLDTLVPAARDAIRRHELSAAVDLLEQALSIDYENEEVVISLKYTGFWKDRHDAAQEIADPLERGDYYLNQWKLFSKFVDRVGSAGEPMMNAMRQFAFGLARVSYEIVYERAGADAALMLRIGRCFKGSGAYDKALGFLESAAAEEKDNPEILAELADCYALVNETKAAKAFFREAFFLGPQRIDLENLESELIRRLVSKVRHLGYNGPALNEWIPVHGVLQGIFTVKRELRAIEYGKLKQAIYSLERERGDGRNRDQLLAPRLINRYFWLIDHYVSTQEDQAKVDEVLWKIRDVDESVYKQYVW